MTYRVLVLDLDGTTLNQDRQLEARDIAAAHALRERGVQLTIATGRLFSGTDWVARALGITGSVALMNGSELVDVTSGTTRLGRYLDPQLRLAMGAVLAPLELPTFQFNSRRIHYGARDARYASYLDIWTEHLQEHPVVFESAEWREAEDTLAIGVVGTRATVAQARAELEPLLPETIGIVEFDTFEGERFLKLRHMGEDKGTALDRMAAERGCTAAQTVAVGDWLNDIPMLRAAGLSFAMAGSTEAVTDVADVTLESQRMAGGAIAEVAARVWNVG